MTAVPPVFAPFHKRFAFASRLRLQSLSVLFLTAFLALAAGCAKSPPPTLEGAAAGRAIAQKALSQVGTRYCSGGETPGQGFDCSGLVQWSYKQCGINVPRTTKEQLSMGRRIEKPQLRAGDVVTFRLSRKGGYHTGVYTGNSKFVHSPSSGKRVREDSLTAEYWDTYFVEGRRHPRLE